MAPPTFSPAKLLELTARDARKRRGNALFAARLQAKYGRAPSLAFMDFLDVEATTALDEKYLEEGDGEDKRVLVQIMGGEDGYGEPTFYDDHAHIIVDPSLFEVLAEVDRVYREDCASTTPSTPPSSLPQAFIIDGYDEDGNDDLYAWRILYTFSDPTDVLAGVLDEAAVAAEMVKQDNELAAAATTTGN